MKKILFLLLLTFGSIGNLYAQTNHVDGGKIDYEEALVNGTYKFLGCIIGFKDKEGVEYNLNNQLAVAVRRGTTFSEITRSSATEEEVIYDVILGVEGYRVFMKVEDENDQIVENAKHSARLQVKVTRASDTDKEGSVQVWEKYISGDIRGESPLHEYTYSNCLWPVNITSPDQTDSNQ